VLLFTAGIINQAVIRIHAERKKLRRSPEILRFPVQGEGFPRKGSERERERESERQREGKQEQG